jgi:hypothetical protein
LHLRLAERCLEQCLASLSPGSVFGWLRVQGEEQQTRKGMAAFFAVMT